MEEGRLHHSLPARETFWVYGTTWCNLWKHPYIFSIECSQCFVACRISHYWDLFIVPCLKYRLKITLKLLDLSSSSSKRERETCIEVDYGKSYSKSVVQSLGIVSPELYRPGCETDDSPLSNVKVKNTWNYILTPIYACMAQCIR
jgi:hypothetical protein